MTRAAIIAITVVSLAAASLCAGGVAHGASVTATVVSAVSLTPTSCQSGTAATSFSTVYPNVPDTITGCTISFASPNDSASLRIYQADGAGSAMWQPTRGALDTSYGGMGTGYRTDAVGAGSYAYGSARLSDGRILSVGEANSDAAVVRYNTGGTIDSQLTFPVGTGVDRARAVATLPDGTAYVAGTFAGPSNDDTFVAKIKPDNTLDTTGFGGGDGIWTWDGGSGNDSLEDVVVQPDGRILVAGTSYTSTVDFLVARLLPNGTPDPSFGTGGITTIPVLAGIDNADKVVLNADGTLFVAGETQNGAQYDWAVAKVDADGDLILGWGSSGLMTFAPSASSDWLYDAALQSDGRLILAGRSVSVAGGNDFTFARMNLDGSLDTAGFGSSGFSQIPAAPGANTDQAHAVIILPDDRIMATGHADSGGNKHTVVRVTKDGAPDPTFGTNGVLVTPLIGSALAIVLEIDGAVAITGGSSTSFANLRMSGWSVDDYRNVGDATDRDWSSGTGNSFFGVCATALTNMSGGWVPGACTTSDGTGWNLVEKTAGGATAKLGSTAGPGSTGTADLVFGIRAGGGQRAGAYVAPIVIEAVAPMVV